MGAATYLNKPVSEYKLMTAISIALQRRYHKAFDKELNDSSKKLPFKKMDV